VQQALRHFEYMVFENLRFLYLQINRPVRVQGVCPTCGFCIEFEYPAHDVYKHLPTFMSTFMMGFPVPEYLRRMMYVLSIQKPYLLDKNSFVQIISRRTSDQREFDNANGSIAKRLMKMMRIVLRKKSPRKPKKSDEINSFLVQHHMEQEWADFLEVNEIRHTYTHAFRLPWAKNTEIYGFPKTISDNPKGKIKDELWDFVKDGSSAKSVG